MAPYTLRAHAESWTKGKRSERPPHRPPITEEEYLALCLVMLARSSDPPQPHKLPPYTCPICNKGFACYQALGGHKASHRKPPAASGACGDRRGGGRAGGHQCTICLRTFASGQALGGHKRCHYDGVGGAAAAAASSECKDFDLNLPAPAEEDVLSPLALKKPRLMLPS